MADITNGIYAEFSRGLTGVKTFLKLSRFDAYLMFKLIQFIARGAKEKLFTNGFVEKFNKFLSETKGEFDIFRIPYRETWSREEAVQDIRKYLDKSGVKYCIQESVNDEDKALHVCVYRKDDQKFNVMFQDYIRNNLAGGELSRNDLVNLTDGKTTIISVPDTAVEDMKNAMDVLMVNYAALPDLMPDDGEKQFRIATTDLNAAKYAYESYKRALLKRDGTAAAVPEMRVLSDTEYLDTAKETPEKWMESVSPEIAQKLAAYDQLEPNAQEKEIMGFPFEIKPADTYECAVFRHNTAYSELSIDAETLVDKSPVNRHLEQKFESFFFCTIPGTRGEQTLMLPKNQVFLSEKNGRDRYIAFIRNDRAPKIFVKGEPDGGSKYVNGKELFEHFDRQSQNIAPKPVIAAKEKVIDQAVPPMIK